MPKCSYNTNGERPKDRAQLFQQLDAPRHTICVTFEKEGPPPRNFNAPAAPMLQIQTKYVGLPVT